jgi:sugar transferase (PEP-CTERM/EpsH1 system associated)
MKILFLTHRVPYPPDKGDKIRSYHLIRHLARRHDIHLACLAWTEQEMQAAGRMKDCCRSVDVARMRLWWSKLKGLTGLISGKPLTVPYFSSPALRRVVRRRCQRESFDLVMIFSSGMAQYASGLETAARIIDFADADSDKWLQYAQHVSFPRSFIYRLEGRRLRKYEGQVAGQFDVCLVISEAEASIFRSHCRGCRLRVVPNGVDVHRYRPEKESRGKYGLVFVGVMDYHANADGVLYFCDHIFPIIHHRVPQVTFTVVGGHPGPAIRRLGRREGIHVEGYVPDVRPYLERAAICVVPLRIARGVQNKILEAMACGLPVVTTSRALEGIEAQVGRDVLVADRPEDFADHTIRLLNNRLERDRLARNGRAMVEEKYQWDKCLQHLDSVLDDLPKASGARIAPD